MGKIPWRRVWQLTPVFLHGKFHGQRSLAGYCPWGCKELDTTEHYLKKKKLYNFLKHQTSISKKVCNFWTSLTPIYSLLLFVFSVIIGRTYTLLCFRASKGFNLAPMCHMTQVLRVFHLLYPKQLEFPRQT